ncbi:MAG TPA: GIDE domain-containing protein [Candidatus Polarisedimenticolia bacterium]|jgi:hypothetical protein|nr:GIDE domain-containing protein [Candidatus Polarisedimenticolia bacterium]
MDFRLDFSRQNLIRTAIVAGCGLAVLQILGPFRGDGSWRHGLYDALAVLGGGALLLFGFVLLRRKRLIENVPTSRIRSVAMGFVELAGLARAKATVAAPYSDIPCVYFRYKVEEERTRSRGGRTWVTIESGDSGVPFHLQDPTGTILVDPAGAETVLRQSFRKVERGEGFFGRRKRYTEWWIVSGQKVFVAGTVRRVRDLALESRATLHDRLRELKGDAQRMSTFDADRDGRISTEEWGNAVRAVQDEVVRDAASAPAAPPEDDVLIGKGSDETTFVIADRSEKWLVGRLALQAGAALAGGAGVVVVFSVSLLARVGILPGGWIVRW